MMTQYNVNVERFLDKADRKMVLSMVKYAKKLQKKADTAYFFHGEEKRQNYTDRVSNTLKDIGGMLGYRVRMTIDGDVVRAEGLANQLGAKVEDLLR